MGDHDAVFVEFVESRYNALVRSACLLTGDRESARDLVQSALARVYARRALVRDLGAVEQYVRRTMVSIHISVWRRHRGRETSVAELPEPGFGDGGTEAADREALLDVWRVLRMLPAKQQAAVVLRYFEDLPISEVARLMGCSEPTVKTHTARALARLRTELDEVRPDSAAKASATVLKAVEAS